jgi:hypothetical protein
LLKSYNLIGIFIVYAVFFSKKNTPHNSKPYLKNPKEIVSTYKKFNFAPNGVVWPRISGYIKGYSILHSNGLSQVKIDNSRNKSDVFVKLVSLDGINAYPVRQFYIKKHGEFTLKNITSGRYDIRYRDLESGHLSRSEYFNLEEIKTNNGTQFSDMTITLFKIYDGNFKTYNLSEEEF